MEGSSSPTLRIRPARPGDVPALFRMKLDLTRAEGNEVVLVATERDWLRDGFGPDARFRSFLAEQAATAIGMVTYSEVYMTALGGVVFSIQDLYVDPARRKLGAGRALVTEVAAAAIERGAPLIQLNVLDSNPARQFYRRLGFQHLRPCLTYAIGGGPMLTLALPAGATAAPPR
ncbi:MAG: N-acetyltransferase family protein [Stellaceae bacterium]